MFDIYHRRIAECDKELEAHLKSFADRVLSKLSDEESASEQRPERKVRNSKNSLCSGRARLPPVTGHSLTCEASYIGSAEWI